MMYEEITIDRSIFYIEQHHIDSFKNMAREMEDYSHYLKEGSLCSKDAWAVAFNIWILLLPDDDIFFELEERSLYFSWVFIIFEALKEDVHFQKLKQRGNSSPELFYLTSLSLATGIIEWLLLVAQKYPLLPFLKASPNRSYFDHINGTEEEMRQFLLEQSKCVKATVKELRDVYFTKMVKKCCDHAYFLYVERFLNQKV